MTLDILGAVAAGLGLLGLVLMLNRWILRNYFGRWLYPATVAFGMIAFTMWSEYSWPGRVLASQPALRLAVQNDYSVAYRPWTFIWPQHNRLITVNEALTRTHPDQPGLVMTQLVLIARWEQVRTITAVFDCVNHASAPVGEGVELNPDGTLEGATWTELEAGDPVLTTVCATAEGGNHEPSNGT